MPVTPRLYFGIYGKLNIKLYRFEDADEDRPQSPETLEYRSYTDYEEEDTAVIQPYIAGKLRLTLAEHTSVSLSDSFQMANVDQYDVNVFAYDGRWFYMNELQLDAVHDFTERLSANAWYRNTWHYQTDESLLFDFVENSVGLGLPLRLLDCGGGRSLILAPSIEYGERSFAESDTPSGLANYPEMDDLKDYDYVDIGVGLTVPVTSLASLHFRGGWVRREYASGLVETETTENPVGDIGLSLTPSPGSPFGLVLTASRGVDDTVVTQTPYYSRPVFEMDDPVFNELNVTYREFETTRYGAWARFDLTRRLRLHGGVGYQIAKAPASMDLALFSGQTESTTAPPPNPTEQRELKYTLGADLRLTEWLAVGLFYEHGTAEDTERPAGDQDLYDYDEVGIDLLLRF